MKKLLQTMLMLMLSLICFMSFVSCDQNSSAVTATKAPESTAFPGVDIHVATLKGPTGMGMVQLMDKQEKRETYNNYSFTLASTPDEIVGKLTSNEINIAAMPTNLAANLYNKTNGKIKIAAINTLGVLYVLEKGDHIQSVSDLNGKTIGATGEGSTPEYILDYILNGNLVEATVEYKSEHAELVTLAATGKYDAVMLPEPFVTTLMNQDKDFRIAFNLTDEFDKLAGGGKLAMGCLVVNTEFAENNKNAVNKFLDEYKASTEYTNLDPKEASILVEKYEIMAKAELIEKAIPNCNITYIEGEPMKTSLQSFYQVLFDSQPKSIGEKMPDDGFYYSR